MSNLYFDEGGPATGQKVCLATVAYEDPSAAYTFSLQNSRMALADAGIASAYMLLTGNCHVDDARNSVIQAFLLSDCTDLVFLDADVSWRARDLARLCLHEGIDLVGGVYPYRREETWLRGSMPVHMLDGIMGPNGLGLLEVAGLPAGFLRIRRHVLETLAAEANKHWSRTERRSQVGIIFERVYDDGVRWGGDLAFCNKCRQHGFRLFADYEMRLGHVAKQVITDSLGASIRRQAGTTLAYVASKVREGTDTIELLVEALASVDNPFAAQEDVLALAVLMARKANGPIIETGSGLTTILMAAANPKHPVFCIEHDKLWAGKLERMARGAGILNIAICDSGIKDGWYDMAELEGLPEHFALGLNDGPPRQLGSRMGFFERLANRCDAIIADDMDDRGYTEAVGGWAAGVGWKVDVVGDRAGLLRRIDAERKVA